MDDNGIIGLYFARSEQALEETDRKYGKLCRTLSWRILDSWPDAEECVSDAWLGAWEAIPPARPAPLRAWLCRLVRNISLNRRRSRETAKRGSSWPEPLEELTETLAAPGSVEGEVEAKELAVLIGRWLDTLPRAQAALFVRRFWFLESYADLARWAGISEKNVSVRLTRLRKGLRTYLTQQGVLE